MTLRKTLLAATIAAVSATSAQAAVPSAEELWEIIQEQRKEIDALKQQVQKSDQQIQQNNEKLAETEAKAEAAVVAVENAPGASIASWFNKTTIGGYAEVLYNNGTTNSDNSDNISKELDVQRFVLFFGHEFTEDLRFFSELEVEHTNTAEDGEVELEQAYIEWDYAENHSVLGGLYLVPIGILNETHEPDTFFGVERNQIESRIIPTTYRVNGLKLQGRFGEGWSYDFGVHEGLQFEEDNLAIRNSRQSGSRANVEELAGTARLKFTQPGFEWGLAFHYQSDFTQDGISNNFLSDPGAGEDDFVAGTFSDGINGLLTETHVIYQNGPFGFRALYARWDIDSDIEDLVLVDGGDTGVGRDEQVGYYIEPSYKLTEKLGIFTRYEFIDERAGSSSGDADDSEERRYLVGLNYWLHPNVVVKADIQFEDDEDRDDSNDLDGFNLGLGWQF